MNNNSFDNQGREINKNNIFLHFDDVLSLISFHFTTIALVLPVLFVILLS